MVRIMNSPWYMKGTFQLPSPCSCGIGLCFDWWMENLMFVPLSPEGKFLHLFMKKLCCYNVFENTCTSLNQNEILTFGIKLFSGQVWLCSNSPSFYISSVEDVSILIRMLPDRIVWCSWQSLISLYINFSGRLIRNFNEFTVIPCKSMWSNEKGEPWKVSQL